MPLALLVRLDLVRHDLRTGQTNDPRFTRTVSNAHVGSIVLTGQGLIIYRQLPLLLLFYVLDVSNEYWRSVLELGNEGMKGGEASDRPSLDVPPNI